MKLLNNQRGFAYIITVVALLLIAGVGFAGYRVLGNSNDNELDSATTQSTLDSTADLATIDNEQVDTQSEASTNTDETASSSEDTATQTAADDSTSQSSSSSGSSTPDGQQTKNITIDSFGFGYSLSAINVSPGDVVTINLTNSGGSHDFVIDELNVATDVISGGETDSVTFTVPASAAGKTFNFYCSVGNHRNLGMEGNFIVSQ